MGSREHNQNSMTFPLLLKIVSGKGAQLTLAPECLLPALVRVHGALAAALFLELFCLQSVRSSRGESESLVCQFCLGPSHGVVACVSE